MHEIEVSAGLQGGEALCLVVHQLEEGRAGKAGPALAPAQDI